MSREQEREAAMANLMRECGQGIQQPQRQQPLGREFNWRQLADLGLQLYQGWQGGATTPNVGATQAPYTGLL